MWITAEFASPFFLFLWYILNYSERIFSAWCIYIVQSGGTLHLSIESSLYCVSDFKKHFDWDNIKFIQYFSFFLCISSIYLFVMTISSLYGQKTQDRKYTTTVINDACNAHLAQVRKYADHVRGIAIELPVWSNTYRRGELRLARSRREQKVRGREIGMSARDDNRAALRWLSSIYNRLTVKLSPSSECIACISNAQSRALIKRFWSI